MGAMLPPRAYTDADAALPRLSPRPARGPGADPPTAVVVAVPARDADRYPVGAFTCYPVHTTYEAQRMIETSRPRVVVMDWDCREIDGVQVCLIAGKFTQTGILIVTRETARVPAALKAGCHAVLLKPLPPNLVAARVGRLAREFRSAPATSRTASAQQTGTNCVWPDTHCPQCEAANAVSFEFHSYRRMWYACLACEHVWLGPRQE